RVIAVLMILLIGVVIYLASSGHYSITFDTAGGDNIPVYKCKYDEYIQIETPSKTGYTFAGWFEDTDLSKPFDLETMTVKAS
ncbi:MAG: InlB B-repeat-containing protein, partial [Coprobacillus sp.]